MPILDDELSRDAILNSEQTRFAQLSDSISRTLELAGITEKELQGGLKDVRQEIAREHYPELFLEAVDKDVY